MEFEYTCTNHNCSYPGKDRFTMAIDEQSVMDDNNMAAIFCPFCKKEMHLRVPYTMTKPACETRDHLH